MSPEYATHESPKLSDQLCAKFMADQTALPEGITFQEADSTMTQSFRETNYPNHVRLIWINDLEPKDLENVTPGHNTKGTCHGYMSYRNLVHDAFPSDGSQRDVSREIGDKWNSESREIHFYVKRSADLEKCAYPSK
jgi:hypothetical protein